MKDNINYRMYIIKPAGMTSKQAVTELGWDDRRTLKRYMIASNEFIKTIHTRQGKITIKLEAVSKPVALCTLKGCNRKHFSRGLCQMHYKQQRRAEG